MGTVFSLDVRAPGVAPSTIADVIRWLHWVDATFSTYRADSQISRLGRGELALADCADEVREVLERCDELERDTGGCFSAHAGGELDPSGYVKGWAIERSAGILATAGSVNHCVNGGGDVQCAGYARPGQPWQVGIADPLRAGELIAAVSGTDLAVATSGTAERGHHIRDPRDGARPCVLSSVTVVGRRLSRVDAFATAAFVMGAAAEQWLQRQTGIGGFIVYPDGRVWSSGEVS